MNATRLALSGAVLAALLHAEPARSQTNVADLFAGSAAVFSNTLSVAGGGASGSGAFAHGYSMATGEYAVALGFGAMALHDKTFVWANRTNPPVASTAPGQFIVHAPGGIYLLGGQIFGNAAGLSNLTVDVDAVTGLGTAARYGVDAFASAQQGAKADGAIQSAGTVPWTGTQDVAGHVLTNAGAVFTSTISHQTNSTSTNMVIGLRVSAMEGYGTPPPACGDYFGNVEQGFVSTSVIVTADGYTTNARLTRSSGQWTFSWTEDTRAYVGALWDESGWGSFWYSRYSEWMTTMAITGALEEIVGVLALGGPCPEWKNNEFTGDFGSILYHPDGNKCFYLESGSWWFQHVFDDWISGLSEAEIPAGDFIDRGTLQGCTYSFNISCITQEFSSTEVLATTSAVPYLAADGRTAWAGTHNAGGFDLLNVGQLQVQVVVGDGSGLFNIGIDALDLESVEAHFVLKNGDTVTGALEVNGPLTAGGRPVATLTYNDAQGDIGMGPFTNSPPEP